MDSRIAAADGIRTPLGAQAVLAGFLASMALPLAGVLAVARLRSSWASPWPRPTQPPAPPGEGCRPARHGGTASTASPRQAPACQDPCRWATAEIWEMEAEAPGATEIVLHKQACLRCGASRLRPAGTPFGMGQLVRSPGLVHPPAKAITG